MTSRQAEADESDFNIADEKEEESMMTKRTRKPRLELAQPRRSESGAEEEEEKSAENESFDRVAKELPYSSRIAHNSESTDFDQEER